MPRGARAAAGGGGATAEGAGRLFEPERFLVYAATCWPCAHVNVNIKHILLVIACCDVHKLLIYKLLKNRVSLTLAPVTESGGRQDEVNTVEMEKRCFHSWHNHPSRVTGRHTQSLRLPAVCGGGACTLA